MVEIELNKVILEEDNYYSYKSLLIPEEILLNIKNTDKVDGVFFTINGEKAYISFPNNKDKEEFLKIIRDWFSLDRINILSYSVKFLINKYSDKIDIDVNVIKTISGDYLINIDVGYDKNYYFIIISSNNIDNTIEYLSLIIKSHKDFIHSIYNDKLNEYFKRLLPNVDVEIEKE